MCLSTLAMPSETMHYDMYGLIDSNSAFISKKKNFRSIKINRYSINPLCFNHY